MILNRQRRVRIPVAELNRFLGAAQRRLRVPAGAVTVALVTDAEMKKWNRAFRGKNRPTDVLSFPVDGPAKTKPKQSRGAWPKSPSAAPAAQ
jgi:ssRNA-specific RNase YbeY (16S rRNA maturation enzyme)